MTERERRETARQTLERRLFALGVPIYASPIRDALDAAYAEAARIFPPGATERALKVARGALQGIEDYPGGYGVNSPYAQAKQALADIADILKEPQS